MKYQDIFESKLSFGLHRETWSRISAIHSPFHLYDALRQRKKPSRVNSIALLKICFAQSSIVSIESFPTCFGVTDARDLVVGFLGYFAYLKALMTYNTMYENFTCSPTLS